MKIFDMHIHNFSDKVDPEGMLARMDEAGVYGGCVFSNWPDRANKQFGVSFDERLRDVMKWAEGNEGRIFPVIWVHPYENNVMENVRRAKACGICAVKIICTDFYVYEEPCMELLRLCAELDLPVIFHSGILWDGGVSSKFNRPINWEALLEIEGLRFSMGHCSWPWIDECIALYGKFLNSLTMRNTAEMFFDITPGTPEIYRRELLTKLYTIGYDVGHNVMFGTDATAEDYKPQWAKKWLGIDGKILSDIGVSRTNLQRLYHDNLMRFLGITDTKVTHKSPVCDDNRPWDATED